MSFWTEYFLFVFGALFGALQIAAAHSSLRGLSFFGKPFIGYLFGSPVVIASFWWFFATSDRNVHVTQFSNFHTGTMVSCIALSLLATLLLTFSINSIVKSGQPDGGEDTDDGLEALKRRTYFQIIRRRFGKGKQG